MQRLADGRVRPTCAAWSKHHAYVGRFSLGLALRFNSAYTLSFNSLAGLKAILLLVLILVTSPDADLYLLIGTLIESVTYTLASIPQDRQSDTARAAVGLLFDRLRAERLL